ncbi:MAG: DegT/DnrJ/EryC1/StrS family aminotransferase [Burkholderiales bacterium]
MRTASLPPWPYFASDEIEAVRGVLISGKANYWTGSEGTTFEREFAGFVGAKYGVALANGSVALELALHAVGVGPGDDVVVPARSFMATASCAIMRGARPVFADVDPMSGNVTAETVRAVLTPKTRAMIVVHLAGWPCDMDPLLELARKHDVKVIEDCAQSHGATYKGRVTGSIGDIGAFSFCQDKILTTGGEGGMLVTNDPLVWDRAWSYKDHGKSYDAVFNREHPPGFRWLHESFGTNWRMTEMQAAIGRQQLKKLPSWLAARRRNAELLDAHLTGVHGLRAPVPRGECGHAYYKYYAFVEPESLRSGWTRERIVEAINAEGIPCVSGSCSEIYLEEAFSDTDMRPAERLPVARALGETSLMFLVHPTLSKRDVIDTATAIRKVMAVAAAG